MFDLTLIFKHVGKVAAKNSPAILTAIGATGATAGVYLAAKAGYNSFEVLRQAEEEKKAEFLGDSLRTVEENEEISHEGVAVMTPEPLTAQEKFEAVWKLYVPAVACLALSVTAVVCANRISDRRAAAMASAYSIVEKSYGEYRAKTVEKIGKKKEEEVRAAVAQDRADAKPPTPSTIIVTGHGGTRVKDEWSGRYFESDIESIRRAVNDFNQTILNSVYGSLTEFYHLLGLDSTKESDLVGWDSDKLLEVEFGTTLHPDNTPCISMDFKTLPDQRYSALH